MKFTDEPSAYTFAKARSVSGSPGSSLFLQKVSGVVSHGGGVLWPAGSPAYNDAVAWINGGLVAQLFDAAPAQLARSHGDPLALPAPRGPWVLMRPGAPAAH